MSSLHLESLENRQLFAVGFDPVTGVLTATGGNGSDQIVVSDAGVNVNVSLNGAVSAFPKAQVKLIKLNGLGGNDSLRSVDSIKIRHEILGGSGNDFCRGGGGNDTLLGGDGNDVIDGGWGADVMQGNAGIDTVDYSHRTEEIMAYLKPGPHTESGSFLRDITIVSGGLLGDLFTGNDIENYRGSSGVDKVYGNDLANKIWGNGGNDILRGGNGNDWLIGGAGADELHGENGNDVLDARDGTIADKLFGGAGVDWGWVDKFFWLKDATNSVEILL
jgi:Ca2+-binding RTX toxin-like protein